jgi:hypothetical protein
MKKTVLLVLFLISQSLSAQYLQLLDDDQNWILRTPDINTQNLEFVNYEKEKVELNTMIWKFLPNGRLAYDYQSSSTVFACAGVNFLDMDLAESTWTYNPASLVLTLQIKGGYASLDDFVFKRDYKVSMLDEKDDYGYQLTFLREQYFNDLKK